MEVLTTASPKTVKGEPLGYLTGILYLLPHEGQGDGFNLCPGASPGCVAGCLVTAGRGVFRAVVEARARRRAMLLTDPQGFRDALSRDIERIIRQARRDGMRPAIRLNGTSDFDWTGERNPWVADRFNRGGESIFQAFAGAVTFYDYTAVPTYLDRDRLARHGGLDLTFSAKENNALHVARALAAGFRASVVFDTPRGADLPEAYHGAAVLDGDEHDLTFLRPGGVILGLRAKGRARRDASGFVVPAADLIQTGSVGVAA